METGECLCHVLMKSLCLPCQVKVHLMHLTASPHAHLEKVLSASASERSKTPCSHGNTTERKNTNCTNCEYYVDIISKLTAGVCEDEVLKMVMSCLIDSSAPGENLRAIQATKIGSECKLPSAVAVAAILRGQDVCAANSTRKHIGCLKSETLKEPTCDDRVSNLYEAICLRPSSTSKTGFPLGTSNSKSAKVGSFRRGNDDEKNKVKSAVQDTSNHVKQVKPASISKGEKEILSMLGKHDTNYRDVKKEDVGHIKNGCENVLHVGKSYRDGSYETRSYTDSEFRDRKQGVKEEQKYNRERDKNCTTSKKSGQHQLKNLINYNAEKARLADENAVFDGNTNYRLSGGVIKNICSGNRESRRYPIENNGQDEIDEKIDRCLERFYREHTSPRHHKCSKSPCHRHCSPSGAKCTRSRLVRSANNEFSNPVTVAFRSRSCGNIDGESYDQEISFNSLELNKTKPNDARSQSGERKLIYQTNSDGQCTSMVIGLPGEDSEKNPERNILINFQRKQRNSPSCSPSRIDKYSQASGYKDVSTQYNACNGKRNSSIGGDGGLWIVSENGGSARNSNVSAKQVFHGSGSRADRLKHQGASRNSSPLGKASTGKQGSTGSPRSTGKQPSIAAQSSGNQGIAGKQGAGKQTSAGKQSGSSKPKVGSKKTQPFRQPPWRKS